MECGEYSIVIAGGGRTAAAGESGGGNGLESSDMIARRLRDGDAKREGGVHRRLSCFFLPFFPNRGPIRFGKFVRACQQARFGCHVHGK